MRSTMLLFAAVLMAAPVSASRAGIDGIATLLAQAPAPATPSPEAAPGEKLTGLAAWNALVGNTIVGSIEGKEFVDYYEPDGTVKSIADDKTIAGRWSLEGDKICFVYPGEPRECYAMEVVGDSATFTDSQGLGVRTRILKGNARNL